MRQLISSILRKIRIGFFEIAYSSLVVILILKVDTLIGTNHEILAGNYNYQPEIDRLQEKITFLEQDVSETKMLSSNTHNRVINLGSIFTYEKEKRSRATLIKNKINSEIDNELRGNRYLTREQVFDLAYFIVEYGDKYSIPIPLVVGIIRQESAFNPTAVSPSNAQGLMQILPSTAEDIAKELNVKSYNLNNIQDNVRFGVYYFAKMLDKFNRQDLALYAYNAGPDYVERYLKREVNSLPEESVKYERRITEFTTNYTSIGLY